MWTKSATAVVVRSTAGDDDQLDLKLRVEVAM